MIPSNTEQAYPNVTRAEGLGVPETAVAVQPGKRTTLGVDKEGQAPCLLPLQYRAILGYSPHPDTRQAQAALIKAEFKF